MAIEILLKKLLGEYFSKVSEFDLRFIKEGNQTEEDIRNTFNYLNKF